LGFHGQIYISASVVEAKKCLDFYEIHFIISDRNMPEETGLDFLKYIRRHLKYRDTAFVMLTTANEMESVIEAIDEGADNYIIKPWTLKDLEDKIDSAWIKRHPPLKAAGNPNASTLLTDSEFDLDNSTEKKDTNKKD
jgi:response regulator of citrate/malate metabolism